MTAAETTPGADGRTPLPGVQTDRSWRIEFPARQELLNCNDRNHWSKAARITKQLRSDGFLLGKGAKLPKLQRVLVEGVYEPPDRRKRDAANLYPSFKAAIDGALVDTGCLPDDDSKHLIGPDMRLGEPYPGGRLVLIVHELPMETSP